MPHGQNQVGQWKQEREVGLAGGGRVVVGGNADNCN